MTKTFETLEEAWANAVSSEYANTNVLVKMLKDATVTSTLLRNNVGFHARTFTLDLNDKTLAYAGEDDACVIEQTGGEAIHIVDTAATRTPRYFVCDETGLWTLTNVVTNLVVNGGVITGGKSGAVKISYGSPNVISNVNFVGNSTPKSEFAVNGGAVSTAMSGYALKITGSSFLGNVANGNGGAISAAGPCEMVDCRVEANVASDFGGGVYAKHHGSLVRTKVVGNKAGTGGGVYLTFSSSSCFPAGTKILMANGSEKNVEEVAEGDVVATFDHVGGTNSSASVFYVYNGTGAQTVFTLSFASGTTLDVADRHDLLLETTRKYVTLSADNARSHVGKRFYNYAIGGWDELVGVAPAKACDAHYSLYTQGHGNCVANGMLTVPDDKDCFVNVYELGENLKADAAQLAADVAKFGLATPADYPNVPLDDFEDGNVRYAFIAIGKGLTTQEQILYWNEFDYGPIVAKAKSAPKTMAFTMKFFSSSISLPSNPYLQVGEGVVVTGNVSAAGADNVYLDALKNAVIDVLPDTTGLDVGVTLSTTNGIFGWTNYVNYAASFSADNPDCCVSYTADGELALRSGIQVGDDAWAAIVDGVCTISGTGGTWSTRPLRDWAAQVREVVVDDGVTSVGNALFHKFYALTNVSCAASVAAVGDHAFFNCHSLERLYFAGETPTLGEQSLMFSAAIRMDGETLVVYTIPDVTSLNPTLYGKKTLADAEWTPIDNPSQKGDYRFFKVVVK